MVQDDYIQQLPFSEVNLDDPFFDSLKYSYLGFDEWFSRKALDGECAYFAFDSRNNLIAMLYLKEESGLEEGVTPRMDFPRLKIGTFKVDFDHHTGIGKRLLAIALRICQIWTRVRLRYNACKRKYFFAGKVAIQIWL